MSQVVGVPIVSKVSRDIITKQLQYVMLPAAFREKCGYKAQMTFDAVSSSFKCAICGAYEVVAKNGRGFIVRRPGIGKSVSTLSLVAF
ncbi:uncharacterized protein PHALS_14304 [Plasmopara halstedii]|uniref:Uncharacterized protein n=1 Tax=Plasmopara halstedii TaxID=4781 RepID=A0A0P1AR21_PLAHL|nr:uncharacterized protein PHALS_14304 [Plasmopara halstedii]CEG44034.1 hypothetical protein PHALS_14304 [Plasmopara halstedii]|eukprot:XP_024580403.1 hypothetical protein PHALS_14304 [Plasmopara halstedii]